MYLLSTYSSFGSRYQSMMNLRSPLDEFSSQIFLQYYNLFSSNTTSFLYRHSYYSCTGH